MNSGEPLTDGGVDELLNVRAILEACETLPAAVAGAEVSSVIERVVDRTLLDTLTGESANSNDSPDWPDRKKRRDKVLTRYLGRILVCVFIRLPGIHYTIEIDPELERVVHCEWQEI